MRFSHGLWILALFIAVFSAAPFHRASASDRTVNHTDPYTMKDESFEKYGKYFWGGPYHNDTRAYLNEAKIPHNSQWDDDTWKPQDWIDRRGGSPMAVIDGFYKAGIITDQYMKDDVPVLEVGQRFLDLSELEKRRVAAFFDHVFGITRDHKDGVFNIVFHEETWLFGLIDDRKLIGIFNADGLQLQ